MKRTLLAVAVFAPILLASPAAAIRSAPEPFCVRHLALDLAIDFPGQRLSGTATCELENRTAQPASDVSLLLNRLMEASQVRDASGKFVRFTQDVVRFRDMPMRQVTQVRVHLPRPVAPGARTTLRLSYAGNLVGNTDIGWNYVRDHIDTSFTILREEPCAFPVVAGLSDSANRAVASPDFTYDVSIRVPAPYVVAVGGTPSQQSHPDGTTSWRYVCRTPVPFLNVCIARYAMAREGDVRVFYFPADSAGARKLMAGAQAAMRTFGEWFGPLHRRPDLCISEIPDGWGSQADADAGIIQSAAAFRDAQRLNELYHELSHLWNAPDTDAPSPRWNEGLATFLELLMFERLDGWTRRAAFDSARIVRLRAKLAREPGLANVPFIDYGKRDMTGESYSVGAIMFEILHDLDVDAFHRIVGGYYQKYPDGATTRDFVAFARAAGPPAVAPVLEDWLLSTRWTQIIASSTSVSDFVRHYRELGGAQPSSPR